MHVIFSHYFALQRLGIIGFYVEIAKFKCLSGTPHISETSKFHTVTTPLGSHPERKL